jgi:branched-chain amino acid transport system permease protein
MLLIVEQFLNGLQFGLLLFLLAAGLTLVFGIMDFVNLAHGSLYMMGAYFAATFAAWTGNFIIGVILALGATTLLGIVLEFVALRHLYGRDHLDQVLGTFGLILFFNDAVRLIWGPAGLALPLPAVAAMLYVVVMRTRVGMLIRAGASNREMIGALGINIKLLFTLVFGLGAALAGLAGLMQAPILTVQIGMGENILILAFVIIVIGGIGSIRGAFLAAIFVGMIDTLGRAFLPDLLRQILSSTAASTAAPALSSMLIYLLMAIVLVLRPEGLFPANKR